MARNGGGLCNLLLELRSQMNNCNHLELISHTALKRIIVRALDGSTYGCMSHSDADLRRIQETRLLRCTLYEKCPDGCLDFIFACFCSGAGKREENSNLLKVDGGRGLSEEVGAGVTGAGGSLLGEGGSWILFFRGRASHQANLLPQKDRKRY